MSDRSSVLCQSCKSSNDIRYCRDCAEINCMRCLITSTEIIYSCESCLVRPESERCGSCGSPASIESESLINVCPGCGSKRIEDPEVLINNLASNFYQIISRVEIVHKDFISLYRRFDIMVGLVYYCRLGNLYGVPQLEMELEKCSNAMRKINQKAVAGIDKIKREGLYDLRSHNYFKNAKLEHYRSLDGVLQNTEQKVDQFIEQVTHWIEEVKARFKQLKGPTIFLREHYDLLRKIKRYLPEGVNDVVAIIPPIAMSIKTKSRRENDQCYTIFTQHYCVFLPKRGINNESVVNGIKVSYADFRRRERSSSMIKGAQLSINLTRGKITINAPPQVLEKVEQYFNLIDSDEPFMVGSWKKIEEIERNAPDKNEYNRATTKMKTIFNEWLFGERVQTPDTSTVLENSSLKDLTKELTQLDRMYKDFNYQARHHQIPLEKYQNETAQIRDNYAAIKDKLARLTGHFGDLDTSFMGQ